jgi:hypothetical protein
MQLIGVIIGLKRILDQGVLRNRVLMFYSSRAPVVSIIKIRKSLIASWLAASDWSMGLAFLQQGADATVILYNPFVWLLCCTLQVLLRLALL